MSMSSTTPRFTQRAKLAKKRKEKAALVIQAATRGTLARKKSREMKQEKKRDASARVIQKKFKALKEKGEGKEGEGKPKSPSSPTRVAAKKPATASTGPLAIKTATRPVPSSFDTRVGSPVPATAGKKAAPKAG